LNFIEKLQGVEKESVNSISIEAKAVPFNPYIPQMEGDFV
jgi:hypothetical protein